MQPDFATQLDTLITQAKAGGCDLNDMAADLRAAADGLETEAAEAKA